MPEECDTLVPVVVKQSEECVLKTARLDKCLENESKRWLGFLMGNPLKSGCWTTEVMSTKLIKMHAQISG